MILIISPAAPSLRESGPPPSPPFSTPPGRFVPLRRVIDAKSAIEQVNQLCRGDTSAGRGALGNVHGRLHTWDTIGAQAAGWEAGLIKRINNDVLDTAAQPQYVGKDLNDVANQIMAKHAPRHG